MIDLSPLVPEARGIVEGVAQVYLTHTRPWFIGLLIHGSALKGGFISGCSDVDFQLFLRDAAFAPNGDLRYDLSISIHRDLARIDPTPFQYIQCYAFPPRPAALDRAGQIGPILGTYHMLLGELPFPEATAEQVREKARQSLVALQPIPSHIANGLLDHGGGRLERHVRLLCTEVWPTLFHVLTCRAETPLEVWKLAKPAAIASLPENESPGAEIRVFHRRVLTYYRAPPSLENGLAVIDAGVRFLQAAKDWYESREAG